MYDEKILAVEEVETGTESEAASETGTVSGGDAGAPSGSSAAAETAGFYEIEIPDYSERFDQLETLIADQNEMLLAQSTIMTKQAEFQYWTSGLLLTIVVIALCHYCYRFFRIFF